MKVAFDVPSFEQLDAAPERAVLFLLDATLLSLGEVMLCEHPTLEHPFDTEEPPPTLALAALIVHQARQLRSILHEYECALQDSLRDQHRHDYLDLPF